MLPGRLESWLHQTSCIITKTLVMRIECLVVKQSDSDIIRQQLAAYFLPVGYGSPRAGGVGWSECPCCALAWLDFLHRIQSALSVVCPLFPMWPRVSILLSLHSQLRACLVVSDMFQLSFYLTVNPTSD